MWKPSAYDWVYPLSYLFTFSIATPHSILVQLAYPKGNLTQGEPTNRAPVAVHDLSLIAEALPKCVCAARAVLLCLQSMNDTHCGSVLMMGAPADNVYGVLPKNGWMVASIIIMLIHQIIAYALCEFPPCLPVQKLPSCWIQALSLCWLTDCMRKDVC